MSKGLKALQEMRKYGAVMTENCEIIEKELKALDIIKRHVTIDLQTIKVNCSYISYLIVNKLINNELERDNKPLIHTVSEEEYDLLRGVLADV